MGMAWFILCTIILCWLSLPAGGNHPNYQQQQHENAQRQKLQNKTELLNYFHSVQDVRDQQDMTTTKEDSLFKPPDFLFPFFNTTENTDVTQDDDSGEYLSDISDKPFISPLENFPIIGNLLTGKKVDFNSYTTINQGNDQASSRSEFINTGFEVAIKNSSIGNIEALPNNARSDLEDPEMATIITQSKQPKNSKSKEQVHRHQIQSQQPPQKEELEQQPTQSQPFQKEQQQRPHHTQQSKQPQKARQHETHTLQQQQPLQQLQHEKQHQQLQTRNATIHNVKTDSSLERLSKYHTSEQIRILQINSNYFHKNNTENTKIERFTDTNKNNNNGNKSSTPGFTKGTNKQPTHPQPLSPLSQTTKENQDEKNNSTTHSSPSGNKSTLAKPSFRPDPTKPIPRDSSIVESTNKKAAGGKVANLKQQTLPPAFSKDVERVKKTPSVSYRLATPSQIKQSTKTKTSTSQTKNPNFPINTTSRMTPNISLATTTARIDIKDQKTPTSKVTAAINTEQNTSVNNQIQLSKARNKPYNQVLSHEISFKAKNTSDSIINKKQPKTKTATVEKKIVFVQLPKNGKAKCMDGSPPAYYIRKGYGTGKEKWIIHLHGGAWCYDLQSCAKRRNSILGSTKRSLEEDIGSFFHGILSNQPEVNAHFYNWNAVVLTYCDGGLFSGNRDKPLVGNGKKYYFQGRGVLKSQLDDIRARTVMPSGKEFVLSGTSAGGLALILQGNYIRHFLPEHAKIRGLVDAGYFLEQDSIYNTSISNVQFKALYSLHRPTLSRACVEEQPVGRKFKCLFPQETAKHVKIPLFFVNSLYDHWQLSYLQGISCVYNNKCDRPSHDRILGFRNKMYSALDRASQSRNTTGVFANSCFAHGQVILDYTWSKSSVDGKILSEAFHDWYADDQLGTSSGYKRHMHADCKLPCNGSCPSILATRCVHNFMKASPERQKRDAELC